MTKRLSCSVAHSALPPVRAARGFSLLELMLAMGMFLVFGLVAVRMANQSAGVSIGQQAQASLNIGIRNAAAQMQVDMINAGTGYFPTYNIPGAPMGAIIASTANSAYDQLTILSFDPNCVGKPTNSTVDTTSGSMTITPYNTTASTMVNSCYNWSSINPIELMVFSNTVNASSGMANMTTFPLTAAATASGSNVSITFTGNTTPNQSSNTGTWTPTTTYQTDPLGISTNYAISDPIPNGDGTFSSGVGYLATLFDNTDWVLKTMSVVYGVDGNNNLYRQVNGGTQQIIASNIMGFKVGALVYNSPTTGNTSYKYLPASPVADPRKIRSLRVSIIGRTNPDPSNPFTNSYDGGHYRIQGTSFIINPRNLSLHD